MNKQESAYVVSEYSPDVNLKAQSRKVSETNAGLISSDSPVNKKDWSKVQKNSINLP